MLSIYSGKKVLITGHTGFKGSWLTAWLSQLGAEVIGVSDRVPTTPSLFVTLRHNSLINNVFLDVRDQRAIYSLIKEIKPDFIFHLAAQAIVNDAYLNPIATISTNCMGVANVLDPLREMEKQVVVVLVTSDKVYENKEWVYGYRENDTIMGADPYSASKGMAELVANTYIKSFFKERSLVRVGVGRAGNVIGGGDWANDRIVPDCVRAWMKGDSPIVRSPESTRPWQHVMEPLSGYLTLGALLAQDVTIHGSKYNFGPPANQNHTVRDLINRLMQYWVDVDWTDLSQPLTNKEAHLLKLNCDKALIELKWTPTLNFEETIRLTGNWYRNYTELSDTEMIQFTLGQIKEYSILAEERGNKWALK
jgi:CDP-glucose 4,6-dehydratase